MSFSGYIISVWFIFFVVSVVQSDLRFYYPIEQISPWSVAHYKDLKCPSYTAPDKFSNHEIGPVIASRPLLDKALNIDGYLCKGLLFTTTCTVTWYLSSSINHSIEEVKLSTLDCIDAIKQYTQGDVEPLIFPPESCAWATVNHVKSKEVHVTLHAVLVDPYTGKLLDPIFPDGTTYARSSNTIHSGVLWIMTGDNPYAQCAQFPQAKGNICRNQILASRQHRQDEHNKTT